MNPELWRRAEEIFQRAVESAPADRVAFLDEACGNDRTLRDEVESLLKADSIDWEFIESPAIELAAAMIADDLPQLAPGQLIANYEVVRLAGKGGMGEVYLARDKILNRSVALKLLPPDYTLNKLSLARFQREAQTASSLNHPNILTIHQLGEIEGRHFIATEFIEGETLRAHIERGPIGLGKALDVAVQIADALAAAHKAGVIHRDIKPENIMLRPEGYVKVLDFGLAKLTERRDLPVSEPVAVPGDASSDLLMGTVRYMSPEQAGGLPVDERSDIFSFGVVLFEMLTGRPYLSSDNIPMHVELITSDVPQDLAEHLSHVPDRLARIVAKCLGNEKESRYRNAGELLADLPLVRNEYAVGYSAAPALGPAAAERVWVRYPVMTGLICLFSVLFLGYGAYRFVPRTSPAQKNPSLSTGTWATKAPISSARSQAEPAVLNGTLYVAGGWNLCEAFATLESYDPQRDSWKIRAAMKTPRGSFAVGVLDGLLYAIGGNVACGVKTASVEAYDPRTDSWSPKPALPEKRCGLVAAVANGKLYAIGGVTDGASLASNTEFDPGTNRWRDRSPMPTPRHSSAAVVVDGKIYVIGGSDGERRVEAYDPVTDSWTIRAQMPTPRAVNAASVIGGRIYVFGGFNGGQVDVYDPTNDTWSVAGQAPASRTEFHSAVLNGSIYIAGGIDDGGYRSDVLVYIPGPTPTEGGAFCQTAEDWVTRAPASVPRTNAVAAVINGVIYVVGGENNRDGKIQYFADNEAYDPTTNTWSRKAPMPTARSVRGTNNAVVEGKLYVIGGNPRGTCTNVNEVYDPAAGSWSVKAPMPTARCHVTVIAANGLIYAIGGNTNTAITSIVEVYDPKIDSWTKAQSMPTARQEVVAGAIDGKIFAAGGWSQRGAVDAVEAYDIATDTWSRRAPMSTPRLGAAGGIVNGQLIVLGGSVYDIALATAEAYDPTTDTWRPFPSMPTTRAYSAAAVIDDTISVIGGANGSGFRPGLTTNEQITLTPCGRH